MEDVAAVPEAVRTSPGPDAGLGVASRVDVREVFTYVSVQLEDGNFRIQAAGLDLSGEELIALATSVAAQLDG